MYTGRIIDPHHHLWDLSMAQHPWLLPGDRSVAAMAGTAVVAQDHRVDDYLRDAVGECRRYGPYRGAMGRQSSW